MVAVETGYAWTPGKTATASGVVLILQARCKGQRSGCGKELVVDLLPLGTPPLVSLKASCFFRLTSPLVKGLYFPFSLCCMIKGAHMIHRTSCIWEFPERTPTKRKKGCVYVCEKGQGSCLLLSPGARGALEEDLPAGEHLLSMLRRVTTSTHCSPG